MSWLFIALGEPLFHSLANLIDSYLSNHRFQGTWIMIFWARLFAVLFLPLTFLLGLPRLIPFQLWPIVIIISLIEAIYLYPYYQALRAADTSAAVALFDLGKLLIPLLAFFVVKERLAPAQYLGFILILASSIFLSLHRGLTARWRLNRAFWYMALVSILLSVEVVLYKYLFQSVSWSTGFAATTIGSFIVATILFAATQARRPKAHRELLNLQGNARLFVAAELVNFLGSGASTLAITLAPVTLVSAVGSIQPLFVLLFAVLFQKRFTLVFKEKTTPAAVIKKMVLFVALLIGVGLIML